MTFEFSKRVGAEPKAGTPRHESIGALPQAHRAASASPPAAPQRRGESAPTDLPAAIRRAEQAWGQRPDLHHTDIILEHRCPAISRETRDDAEAHMYVALAAGNIRLHQVLHALVTGWDAS